MSFDIFMVNPIKFKQCANISYGQVVRSLFKILETLKKLFFTFFVNHGKREAISNILSVKINSLPTS